MIAIFIIIVMAIALIGAAGYGIMALMDSSGISVAIQRNVVRMDIVSAAIRAGVRMDNGRVLVPVNADFTTRLAPAIAPFTKTTWGRDIVYCPVSPSDPVAGNEEHVLGDDYAVTIKAVGGLPYVSGGGPGDATLLQAMRDRHVIALLISPDMTAKKDDPAPKCSQITLSNEAFNVPGGEVVAVNDVQAAGTGYGRVFVLSTSGSPISIPPGAVAINSVESAASYIINYGLPDATIRLPAGESGIDYKVFEALQDASSGRTIRFIGTGASVLRIDYPASSTVSGDAAIRINGSMEINGVAVKGYKDGVEAIDMIADVLPAGVLSLVDSSVGGLRVSGGKAYLGLDAEIAPRYSAAARAEPVIAFGGQVFVAGNSTPVVSSSAAAVGMKASGGDIAVAGPIIMSLAPGGKAFATFGGGRLSAGTSNASVKVNTDAAGPIDANVTLSDKVSLSGTGIKRSLVTSGVVACADGSDTCQAVCPTNSIVAWGECGSTNGHALAGFGVDDAGTSWTCRWTPPSTVAAPTAKAVCSALP
jgi:hypothetical protein